MGPSAAHPATLLPVTAHRLLWLVAAVAFVVLATANGAGYRYGVSDQAFYIPAVTHALDAASFPRDAVVIDAQGRLMVLDDMLAAAVRGAGVPLDVLFVAGYLLSLAVIWIALVLIGGRLYRSPWAIAALAAAFTLRHRIPRTSANSFEPYFHPRMLAFGIGALAIAAVLRRRWWPAVLLVAAAALVHITTAMWFAVLIGVALAILDRRMRQLAIAGLAGTALITGWALTAGPLRSSFATMDDLWLQAVASKDSLFAFDWPLWAWAANLALLPALWWAQRVRRRHGLATAEDAALLWGAAALVALFLATLPLVALRQALPVQLQISRVFWLLDFLVLAYVVGAIDAWATGRARPPAGRSPGSAHTASAAFVAAALLLTVAAVRGAFIMLVERPDRPLFALHLPQTPWDEAMQWLSRQPLDVHVFADPGHAWKYGTSVRVSAGRDVLLEEVKDSAIAIYSRDVAVRVVERTAAIGDFAGLTAPQALGLARRYGLDYLVTEADLPLPEAYRNSRFRIYALR